LAAFFKLGREEGKEKLCGKTGVPRPETEFHPSAGAWKPAGQHIDSKETQSEETFS